MLGDVRLSQLTAPLIRNFEDTLTAEAIHRRWCEAPALARGAH